ncbi:hypothetical protein B0H16DRAFT_1308634, partial [Mycena metata]
AGTGKSAVARALCLQPKADGHFGGGFFFEKGHPSRGIGTNIFTAIAHQLSLLDNLPALKEKIYHTVEENPSLLWGSLGDQLQRLIIEPCTSDF